MLEEKILEMYNGNTITKKFTFNKIPYSSYRKINPVEVSVSLYTKNNKVVFTASGTIYNSKKTDCYCAGQCLDEIAKYVYTPTFKTIYKMWKLYHLNDMHAGTKEQEELVVGHNYDEAKKILAENNMLTVKLADGTDYTYGHSWLYRHIPENDLETIYNLIK